jgi:hypothetical protein
VTGPARRSEWLTPPVMMFVAGLAMAAFGSYQTFKSGASDRIASLEYRMTTQEKTSDRVDGRLDRYDKGLSDMALKVDRLERHR